MKLIHIKDQLPADRQRVLFYNEKAERWSFGIYYEGQDLITASLPGFLGRDCFWWAPEPDKPGQESAK